MPLVHIDLSGLQQINEAMGRDAGDGVLRVIGVRLNDLTHRFPSLIVARTAGDEFAGACRVKTPAEAKALAERMAHSLSLPALVGAREIDIMVCVGFATRPENPAVGAIAEAAAVELARQADVALAFAKRLGPGGCAGYESEADDRVRHRMLLKQSMQRALSEHQFEMHYQPYVDLHSGEIVGAEALVRWQHPDLGMQRPDLFLPIAEETGLIVPLGEWVIRDVMHQAQLWRQAGIRVPRLSINVSSKQLQRQNLADTLAQALDEFWRTSRRLRS